MTQPSHTLHEDDSHIELLDAAQHHQLALEMFRQARREIFILSHDLDAPVLDHADIVEAISQFARDNRYSEVRILLQTPDKANQHGHRLVTLAQRLSSSIHIHKPGPEHQGIIDAYMVVDGNGVIKRPQADRYEGLACFKAPIEGRDLRAHFIKLWERSEPEIKLRRLQL